MARSGHTIEKLIDLVAENGAKGSGVQFLFGAAAPGGDTGEQDDAPIGSIYARTDGKFYAKIADANSTADWEEKAAASVSNLNWRPELVQAATDDTLSAGAGQDPTSWTDNESGVDATNWSIGDYVIGDCDGTPALWEITAKVSGTSITLAAAGTAIAANDTFVGQSYLPDSPGSQEVQAILHFPSTTSCVKIGDLNWDIATGIQISSGYTPGSGDITSSDTVESAIEKLDGNNDDQDTLLGTSQGDTNLGTFTGATIPDSSSVKGALQSMETAYEETDANVDDLITLSGVAENSTSFGTFTGDSLADSQTAKQLYQRIETLLEQMRGVEVTGLTTLADVDTVVVDDVCACAWQVCAFEEATPANKESFLVHAIHNGTASADATLTDDTVYAKIKTGSNFNLVISTDVNGTGAAQTMRLRASSSTAGVTITARRIETTKSVL
jgi:hypothetical protein